MSFVNLYVQIGDTLLPGRIIQSVYFLPDRPSVIVTYLNGKQKKISLGDFLTETDIDTIYSEICAIHASGCYPQNPSDGNCNLDMVVL